MISIALGFQAIDRFRPIIIHRIEFLSGYVMLTTGTKQGLLLVLIPFLMLMSIALIGNYLTIRSNRIERNIINLENQWNHILLQADLRYNHFYQNENANVHRGVHWLSEQATLAYEQARGTVAAFVGANAQYTLVFTRGTTESINLVAQTFGLTHIKAGDEIILSMMEHHANCFNSIA
mgnify:CR=1 FL=1